MAKRNLGNDKRIEANRKYLEIAQDMGCFQDYPNDLALCKDWIIVLWINELTDKSDIEKFKSEQLPALKRWYSKGVRTTGIGRYYPILRLLEDKGVVINVTTANCMMNLCYSNDLFDALKTIEKPESVEIFNKAIDNIITFSELGMPICGQLGTNYTTLMRLKEMGEPLNYDTLVFFAPTIISNDKMVQYNLQLYESGKKIAEKFNYMPATTDEVEKLLPYLRSKNGYNQDKVDKIEKQIEAIKQRLRKTPNMSQVGKEKCWEEMCKKSELVGSLKSRNIIMQYYKKFGTLAGLANLNQRAAIFIDTVDADFPVDSLYAVFFEDTSFIPSDEERFNNMMEIFTLLHDHMINDNRDMQAWNDNIPLDKYVSLTAREYIDNVVAAAGACTKDQYADYLNIRKKAAV